MRERRRGGGEDPWLCGPGFRRVCLYRGWTVDLRCGTGGVNCCLALGSRLGLLGALVKALSLRQPWATLVAIRAKKIETRSWSTAYRGMLAIHAAAKLPKNCRTLAQRSEPFRSVISQAAFPEDWEDRLPGGAVVATARLEHCSASRSIVTLERPSTPTRRTSSPSATSRRVALGSCCVTC
jgi:pimeloyl-ACP methyl ester carboxylesterase